jgi:uncharacterized membrane protein
MHKTRLEAFTDAVIAIIMTIMVLELEVPEGADWEALKPVLPIFLAYILSYFYLAVYWSNHHHMMQAVDHVDGLVLIANTHLVFWLSLIPFATAWMETNEFAPLPTAAYGAVLLLAAIAYSLLQFTLLRHHGKSGVLRAAVGRDIKGKASIVAYALAIPLSFVNPQIAIGVYIFVGLIWLIPDRRIEKQLRHAHD